MAAKSDFDKVPPELCEEMFEPVLEWNGRTPDLIVALRPKKRLYSQALDTFYKKNTFTLHQNNDWSFGDMLEAAKLTVERLEIHMVQMRTGNIVGSIPIPSSAKIQTAVAGATNVKEVHFSTDGFAWYDEDWYFLDNIDNYLASFKDLTRLSIVLCGGYFFDDRERDKYDTILTPKIDYINELLGTHAKLLTVNGGYGDTAANDEVDGWGFETRTWFWQAEEGKFLKAVESKET